MTSEQIIVKIKEALLDHDREVEKKWQEYKASLKKSKSAMESLGKMTATSMDVAGIKASFVDNVRRIVS